MGAAQLVFGDFEEDEILSKTKWSKVRKKKQKLHPVSSQPLFL